MTLRVAVAGVFHETNTFSSSPTDLRTFHNKLLAVGEDLAAAFTGTRTVVGGFLDGARSCHLDVVPVYGAYATPSGLVTRAAFDTIAATLVDKLEQAKPFNAVLLELHGSMVVDGLSDPETLLLAAVRNVAERRPIVVVTDLHANMTPERLALIDILTGYRTNPHVDTYERGVAAARHCSALLRDGVKPTVAHRRVAVLAAPIAQSTSDEPLRHILARARMLEQQRGLLDVTVHGGYAYADVPHARISVTVTARNGNSRAGETAEELAALAWERRAGFAVDLPGPADAFAQAVARAGGTGPVALADTGDNIGGGSAGDGTWLLREALAHPGIRVAATICDPSAAAAAWREGAGGRLRCDLGGRSEATAGQPVSVDAAVRWVGEGTFTNTGPMARGARVNMGPSAVLAVEDVDIVVQSLPVQPNDPELFRCTGLDPGTYDVIVLKGAAALRAGWKGLVRDFVDAGTPGVTDTVLGRMPYRHVERPVWPLDA